MFRIKVTSLAIVIVSMTPLAQGDVQVFDTEDRQQWFDAVGTDITTIHFTGFPNNTNITDQYSDLGLTFDGLNFITLDVPSFEDDWGLRIFDGNDLYFSEPINWIAADFLGTIAYDVYMDEQFLFTSHSLGHSGFDQFGGIISDQPFNRVFVYDLGDGLTVIDDLHFGPPIPAPPALAPFAVALFAGRLRRRGVQRS